MNYWRCKSGVKKERTGQIWSLYGFQVYTAITYQYIKPYLKGLNLNLDSWIPIIDKEGGRMQGEELNLADMDGI